MAKRVKQRLGSRWWRTVEVAGWTVVAGGFLFLVYSLDAAIRAGNSAEQPPFEALGAGAACFFGSVLAMVARASDTQWSCSPCEKPLRAKGDKACLNCMVLLD